MADLRARVAYLQGLMEGMDVEAAAPHGRILAEIVDVLGDIAEAVTDVQEAQADLEDYVDEMDEDLTELASEVYFEPDFAVRGRDGDDEETLGELCCPECGETLALEAGKVNGEESISVVCPNCNTTVGAVDTEKK